MPPAHSMPSPERMFRVLADSASVMIWMCGTDKECYYFNQAWLQFRGRDLDAEYGFGWAEGVHPDDYDRCIEIFVSAFDKHEAFTMDYRLRHHSGAYRWIRDDGAPIFSPEGAFEGYIGSCYDIDESIAIRQDLIEARNNAEAANEAKSRFLSNMSHEVRTPMNGILGTLDLALEGDLSNDQRELMKTARTCAESLLAMLGDVLDASAIESGEVAFSEEAFAISSVVDSINHLFAGPAATKNLGLTVAVDPDIPGTVISDQPRLLQVLIHLIGNALKFTETGGVEITISHAPDSPQHLLITINDSGIGIPIEQRETLLGLFSQADATATRPHGGSGLGLSISAGLINSAGGRLSIGESPRGGASLTFSWHYMTPGSGTRRILARSHRKQAPNPSKLTILVVEDQPVNRLIIQRMLEAEGWDVVMAEHGRAGIEIFQAEVVDVILMDIQMPIMGGEEATSHIRDLPGGADVPIIAVTANAVPGDRERFLAHGMTDYLSKPVRKETLMACIRKHTIQPDQ